MVSDIVEFLVAALLVCTFTGASFLMLALALGVYYG